MTTEFIHGVVVQAESNETFPVDVVPPDGTRIELKRLISMNGAYEFMLLDGRIGERLLPIHGPIDISLYKQHMQFEMGVITEEEPLRLYFEVFDHPSVLPYLNFVVIGDMENWIAPERTEVRRHRVGELSISEYEKWLRDQMSSDELRSIVGPAKAFVAGWSDFRKPTRS